MISSRSLLICVVLIIVQACAQDQKVVKELQFSRVAPAWRTNTRVRQVQGNFPMASFFDGGARPKLFGPWSRRFDQE